MTSGIPLSCRFVDAPVSGGVNAANAGTLTFMVGAESEQNFGDAKALLDLMGAKVVHCGKVGGNETLIYYFSPLFSQYFL